jgi:parallel beta-helix repeat protein
MKRIISGIMLTLLLISMVGTISNMMPVAVGEMTSFEVYISPESPTTHDVVNASIGFCFPSEMPSSVVFGNLTRVGYTFTVDINISAIFLFVVGPWIYNHTYCLDTLPQGSYSFTATAYSVLNGTRNLLAQIIKPFTVASARIIVPDDYPTIQEAINNANPGDIIFVRDGTYYEHVVVNKAVWLVGEDRQTTRIDGNNTAYCVIIQSNGVALEDFIIENGNLVDVMVNQNVSQVVIKNNFVINSDWGIYLAGSLNCTVEGNLVKNCRDTGIFLESSSYNTIIGNTIVNNHEGVALTTAPHIPEVPPVPCRFNTVHHNNFLNNSLQAVDYGIGNRWDDGYSSGGNYWSDYNCTDLFRDPYQNETGSDGIGDKSYVINVNNVDHYPLMKPYPWGSHDIGITYIGKVWEIYFRPIIIPLKTVIELGFRLHINVFVMNYGSYTEALNVTVYANTTSIDIMTNITLASRDSVILNFTWNTAGFAKGNYTISAYATPVPGEIDTADNTYIGGTVKVTILGDVDGDSKVTILDVVKITSIYASKPGDPKFNPNCDIDDDGKITILDVVSCTSHYGQKCP